MHSIDLRVSKKSDHMVTLIFNQPYISHRETLPPSTNMWRHKKREVT